MLEKEDKKRQAYSASHEISFTLQGWVLYSIFIVNVRKVFVIVSQCRIKKF